MRIISWEELERLIFRGINLFAIIRDLAKDFVQSHYPPKTIKSGMNNNVPTVAGDSRGALSDIMLSALSMLSRETDLMKKKAAKGRGGQ